MNEEGERGTRNLWCAPTTMRKICRKLFMVLICNYFHKRDTNHLPCGDFFIQKKISIILAKQLNFHQEKENKRGRESDMVSMGQ